MSKTILNRVIIAYPSGNTTAMIFHEPSGANRKLLNKEILDFWKVKNPDRPIEQCCYLRRADNSKAIGKVVMFGEEFCANATRSAVWVLTQGKNGTGLIETSGYIKPLRYQVKNGLVTLEIPIPVVKKSERGSVVEFGSITHLVIVAQSTRHVLEKLLDDKWLGLTERSAVGVSGYDAISMKANFSVWVKNVDTIFDETACGSGTAAIGIVLAKKTHKNQNIKVCQPSGEVIEVIVKTNSHGTITKVKIAGKIKVLFDGQIVLPSLPR